VKGACCGVARWIPSCVSLGLQKPGRLIASSCGCCVYRAHLTLEGETWRPQQVFVLAHRVYLHCSSLGLCDRVAALFCCPTGCLDLTVPRLAMSNNLPNSLLSYSYSTLRITGFLDLTVARLAMSNNLPNSLHGYSYSTLRIIGFLDLTVARVAMCNNHPNSLHSYSYSTLRITGFQDLTVARLAMSNNHPNSLHGYSYSTLRITVVHRPEF
jgi:hypothetical protein